MTEKEQRFVNNWEKTRGNGKIQFLLTVSFVFILVLPIINLAIDYFQSETEFVFKWNDVGVNAVVGLAIGMFLGVTNWSSNEKKYHQIKEQK